MTTAEEPNYGKLMKARAAALKKNEVKLQDVFKMVEGSHMTMIFPI